MEVDVVSEVTTQHPTLGGCWSIVITNRFDLHIGGNLLQPHSGQPHMVTYLCVKLQRHSAQSSCKHQSGSVVKEKEVGTFRLSVRLLDDFLHNLKTMTSCFVSKDSMNKEI